MEYSDLEILDSKERKNVLEGLSSSELADLFDQQPRTMAGFVARDDRQYFDDIETLHAYMLESYVPATKPWLADEAAAHEFGHAFCALALGAVGVRYYSLNETDKTTRSAIFTHAFGPATLPNLAFAAISMHPFTASRSIADMRNLHSYGYASRQQVAHRIELWNSNTRDLYIPEPQTSAVKYP
jgi:hypothetical protein